MYDSVMLVSSTSVQYTTQKDHLDLVLLSTSLTADTGIEDKNGAENDEIGMGLGNCCV